MALNRVNRLGDRFGCAKIPKTPTGHGIRFAEAVHCDRQIVILLSKGSDAEVPGIIV